MKRLAMGWLFAMVVTLGSVLQAQSAFNGLELVLESGQDVTIVADKLEFSTGDGTLLFGGHVLMTQPGLELRADQVAIDAKDGRIIGLTASGHVTITRKTWRASAGKLVYSRQADSIRLSESPRVEVDGNRINGDTITFFIGEGRVLVDGAKTQVRLPEPKAEDN